MKKLLFILSLVLSFNTHAQTSGNCGPKDENGAYTSSCVWNYDEKTHTLSFTGDGYMESFGANEDVSGRWHTKAPWRDFDQEIEYVNIGGNLKNISGCSVYGFTNLKDMSITAPIESFGQEVFSNLQNFEIPSTVKVINAMGLAHTKADSLVIPDSVKYIGEWAFEYTQASKIILGSNLESIDSNAFYGTKENLEIYCEDTSQNRCRDLISQNNSDYVGKLKYFTKDETTGVYNVDETYYADANLLAKGISCQSKSQCDEIALKAKNGLDFEFNGKFYTSLKDLKNANYIKKRIYTIDEANAVAGDKNRVSIKYR